jgi:DNA-binding winged helix-turn-helix (wHTH) protein
MDIIKSDIYGYSIGNTLLYHRSAAALINTDRIRDTSRGQMTCIRLRKTMAVLLEYLLSHAECGFISDDELISCIWERNGLKGSSARLWQVMSSLRKRLQEAGCSEEFIFRVNSGGYMLREKIISPVYCNTEYFFETVHAETF